jgi:predicted amidophosphoribosyltransferase
MVDQGGFCTECGAVVSSTDRFCAGCGHNLGGGVGAVLWG